MNDWLARRRERRAAATARNLFAAIAGITQHLPESEHRTAILRYAADGLAYFQETPAEIAEREARR